MDYCIKECVVVGRACKIVGERRNVVVVGSFDGVCVVGEIVVGSSEVIVGIIVVVDIVGEDMIVVEGSQNGP